MDKEKLLEKILLKTGLDFSEEEVWYLYNLIKKDVKENDI